jgi:hypothetical protein
MITTRATTQNGWKKRKEKSSLTRGFFFSILAIGIPKKVQRIKKIS